MRSPHRVDADAMETSLTGEVAPVRRAALSLGSNLGDRLETLSAAVASLAETPGVALVAVSPVYETTPVGAPDGSPDFLNAVVVLDTALTPTVLLERCLALEAAFGRVDDPGAPPGAPRPLDIDLLVVGDLQVEDGDRLRLPHPRIAERAFVLVPWSDVDPDARVPGVGAVQQLLARVGTDGVRRTASALDGAPGPA